MVRDLFRNKDMTEFVIATIPTMLGINESARLLKALRKEDIPCRRIIVNQVTSSAICLLASLQACMHRYSRGHRDITQSVYFDTHGQRMRSPADGMAALDTLSMLGSRSKSLQATVMSHALGHHGGYGGSVSAPEVEGPGQGAGDVDIRCPAGRPAPAQGPTCRPGSARPASAAILWRNGVAERHW